MSLTTVAEYVLLLTLSLVYFSHMKIAITFFLKSLLIANIKFTPCYLLKIARIIKLLPLFLSLSHSYFIYMYHLLSTVDSKNCYTISFASFGYQILQKPLVHRLKMYQLLSTEDSKNHHTCCAFIIVA